MSLTAPDTTETPTATQEPQLSWRQRRRHIRKTRPMYKRADRSTYRSLIALFLPVPAAAVASYLYLVEDELIEAAKWGGGAAAGWLVLSPLALWWAVSALRRGTRLVLTSIMCGIISGFGTVALATAIYAAAAGWTLLTGEPLPEPLQNLDVPIPDGIR